VPEIVGTFGWAELLEQRSDAVPDGGDGPFVRLAEQGLEFGKDHLDRIEVRAVGRQEQQVCAGISYCPTHSNAFVAAQIVEHDDVARPQGWHQELCHPCQEQAAIDGAVKNAGGNKAVGSQGGQERHGGPARVRHRGDQTLSAQRSAMGAGHVGLGPGLVDEDQAHWINAVLVTLPPLALAGDVGTVLLGGAQGFYGMARPSSLPQ
jgi:hypothetical protein